jgi:hypothetical protein
VVVHTGVAIKILLTWIFIGVSTIYIVCYSVLLTIKLPH